VGHAIDESRVGCEKRIAVKFVIVYPARAGKGSGLADKSGSEKDTVMVEISGCDSGETIRRLMVEVGAAVAAGWAIIVSKDMEAEFAGFFARADFALGVDGSERLRA
jgi:hypothetical protein